MFRAFQAVLQPTARQAPALTVLLGAQRELYKRHWMNASAPGATSTAA